MASKDKNVPAKRKRPVRNKPKIPSWAAEGNEDENTAAAETSHQSKLKNWSPEQLLELLEYFKKNGWDGDNEVLYKAFAMHTPISLREVLQKLGRNIWDADARPTDEKTETEPKPKAPIEEWLTLVFPSRFWNDHILDLPRMLELISKYEQHPDPKETGGVDYSAIYKYLAALVQGHVPQELNPASARKVLEMLECVVEIVRTNTTLFQDCVQENAKLALETKDKEALKAEVLKNRRREEWSEHEKQNVETLIFGQFEEALQLYLRRPGFNPLSFPVTVQRL